MRFKLLFFVLLIFFSFSLIAFSQQEMVRLVYFYGKDRVIDQNDVKTKMTALANSLLDIYNGLIFEKENNAVVVHIVKGNRNADDYIKKKFFNLFPANPETDVLDEIQKKKNFDMSKDIYLVVANIDNPNDKCGEGGFIKETFGFIIKKWIQITYAFVYESADCVEALSVYHAAHELGHGFGLKHDFRDPSYIMSYGASGVEDNSGTIQWQIPDKLSPCATEWLKTSKFFNANYSANTQQVKPNVSSKIYYQNTQELHLQLTGTGVADVHQVQLHIIFKDMQDGYFPKDPDRDNRWLQLEDKYSLHSCCTFEQDQTNKNQIVFHNVNLSKSPPNNVIRLRVIDTNGNFYFGDISADAIEFKDVSMVVATTAGQQVGTDQPTSTGDSQESRLRATLTGHTDFVTSVAFSPNGRTLASGSWDDTIRLWNPHTMEHFRTLTGHSNDVTSVAFHPVGTWLASGSWDTTIGVWEVNPGKTDSWFYRGNGGFVTSVAYLSTGGQRLAWGSEDNAVRVTYQGDGFPDWGSYYKNNGHEHDVSSIAFSADGQTLASGSWDNTIILWDSPDDYLTTLIGHTDFVTSVAFSPNGKILASGSWDNTIILWDVASHEVLLTLTGHTDRVLAVAFSLDGRSIASGSDDQTIRLWDVATGQQKDTLLGHTSGVTAVAFSPDRRTLASTGGWDNTVRLWDLSPTPTPGPTVKITPSPVVSPDVGDNITVKINISGIQNVAGYQATVHFDPTALRYVESANGTYLPTGSLFVPPVINANQVTLAATSLSGDSNGAGTLATLTFEVVAVKPSSITLSDVMIMEQDLTSIPIIVKGGDVVVLSANRLDVNGDGIVNIQDLTIVATHFGTTGINQADVNNDSIVDIRDLLLVAGGINADAAAPLVYPQTVSILTAEDIQIWLSQAQQFQQIDATYQKGIAVLQQLLAALTPQETSLLPNYPNPFNPETWIPYQLAEPADVTLTIYSVDGKLVRGLVLGHQPAGIYQSRSRAAYWDGKNALGESVASGVYFYTLKAGEFTATRKMLVRK